MVTSKKIAVIASRAQHLAWQRAKTDADVVEATALGKKEAEAPEGNVYQERLLLDRLRSTENAKKVSKAWVNINKYQKENTAGQRVIKRLLEAATLSSNTKFMLADYQRSNKDLQELKYCADQLYKYFTDTVERDPTWKIVAGGSVSDAPDLWSVRNSLVWMRLFLNSRVNEFSQTFGQIGLTRKDKAATARRVNFTVAMSDAMLEIFGRPLDDVVLALAMVFFDTEDLTVYQIKHAREAAELRRRRADAPEFQLPTAQIDKIIGIKGQIDGGAYRFVLTQRDPHTEQGMPKPVGIMDVVTGICFRPTGDRMVAMSGDFVLRAHEVEPVGTAMRAHGIDALVSDMGDEEPSRLSFMHFWAAGDSIKIATGLRAAMDKTTILS
jgi:hypothetical protein